jgi:galactokinase
MDIQAQLQDEFLSRFDGKGELFFCPGRVNLIGDHIDYNGGLVLPIAISKGIYAIASFNNKGVFRVYSLDFPKDVVEFSLATANLKTKLKGNWAAFVAGTFLAISEKFNTPIPCLNIVFAGDLPKGSGLSSSAAIEVLSGFMAAYYAELSISLVELAIICKQVENEFIGVNCGIMDQFAVANGKTNQAILLNCSNLSNQYFPIDLGAYSIVIMNSRKPRQLVESKYNERREECELALKEINHFRNYATLCEATEADLEFISDISRKKRVRHVITENQRVKDAANALSEGALQRFGKLLNASHLSLKEDYEVSGEVLDTLCELANQERGCLGARMTGAGFGGCAIALVLSRQLSDFKSRVAEGYFQKTGIQPELLECEISEGVRKLAI